MSPFAQARIIFKVVRGNPAAIKVQMDALDALTASITSVNGGMQIINAQVNGQGFTSKPSSTPQEKLQVLSILKTFIQNDTSGSKTVVGGFR